MRDDDDAKAIRRGWLWKAVLCLPGRPPVRTRPNQLEDRSNRVFLDADDTRTSQQVLHQGRIGCDRKGRHKTEAAHRYGRGNTGMAQGFILRRSESGRVTLDIARGSGGRELWIGDADNDSERAGAFDLLQQTVCPIGTHNPCIRTRAWVRVAFENARRPWRSYAAGASIDRRRIINTILGVRGREDQHSCGCKKREGP